MQPQALSKKDLLFYGSLATPLAMLGLPLYIYLPTYYSQTLHLNVAVVGMVLFFARLSDVFIDPFLGYTSDQFNSRFGKRKPFIAVGVVVLIISFYALIHPPSSYQVLWLFIFSTLVYFGWSLVSIPYLAWSAEISTDSYETTRLSSARELFAMLGLILALLIPYLYDVSHSPDQSLQLLYGAFLITLLMMLPLNLFGLHHPALKSQSAIAFWALVHLWKKSPELYRLQGAFVLNSLGNALPATLFLFYVELVLQIPQKTGTFLLVYFAAGIVALPFWTWLSNKIGKSKSWSLSMILASIAFAFVPFLNAGDTNAFLLITIISGLSLGADMALPSSMQADIVQKLQKPDENFGGVLFGIWAMLTKLSLAFAVGIGFVILGIVGFDPAAPSQNSLLTLSLLYGTLPVLLKLSAVLLIHKQQKDS